MKYNISIAKTVLNIYIYIYIYIYISYILVPQLRNLNADFTLGDSLFGSVKLTKNVNLDKCKYSGYDIGFDSRWELSLPYGSIKRNAIIFGADLSSSVHADNKGKDILILGEGPTQRLYGTTLTAEEKYSINFTQSGIRFVLSLHYNFLFVNATNVYQFKAKELDVKRYALCLVTISKYFTTNNMAKLGPKD